MTHETTVYSTDEARKIDVSTISQPLKNTGGAPFESFDKDGNVIATRQYIDPRKAHRQAIQGERDSMNVDERQANVKQAWAERFNKRQQLVAQHAKEAAEEEYNDRYDAMTPIEKQNELQRIYIPKIQEAKTIYEDSCASLENFNEDAERVIELEAHNAVYGRFDAPGYKRVFCPGKTYYNEVILKDEDLAENWIEVHRINGAASFTIVYRARGTKQVDLLPAALEAARKEYQYKRPGMVKAVERAYLAVEEVIAEYETKLSEIVSIQDVIEDFRKLKVPGAIKTARATKKKE